MALSPFTPEMLSHEDDIVLAHGDETELKEFAKEIHRLYPHAPMMPVERDEQINNGFPQYVFAVALTNDELDALNWPDIIGYGGR